MAANNLKNDFMYTNDYCFEGQLKVCQPKAGFRFSVDAVLLGRWVRHKKQGKVLDLGCGCGIMALMLALLYPDMRVIGIEIQKILAETARHNAELNSLDNLRIVEGDVRNCKPAELGAPFDIIICNPPFFKPGAGRVNLHAGAAQARHEINLDLPQLAETSRRLLSNKGRLYVIYPAERLGEAMALFAAAGLMPKRLRCIHSRKGDAACLVLLECCYQGRHGLKVEPPLYIYKNGNDYTDEVAGMYRI